MIEINSDLISVARPYARAAFSFALEHKDIAAWADMLKFMSVVVADPKVATLLDDPRITQDKKLDFFLSVSKKLLDDHRRRFLKVLAKNKRLQVLPAIHKMFADLRAEHDRIIVVNVDTAFPFSQQKEDSLLKALKIRLQRDVILEFRIDESLIGGAIIRAGDLVIDGSIKGQLAQLEKALEN